MSTGDWMVLLLGVPPILLTGAWSSFRVWRQHEDVSQGARWAVGDHGAPGYLSFLLPGTVAITLMWLALLSSELWDPDSQPGGAIPVSLFAASMLSLAIGFWTWLFMWPRVLVPPSLRGQPGWIAGAWRARRARSEHVDEP